MKWFRHMSDASDNDFITQLEDAFGLEGYARWWKLVEAVSRGANPRKGQWSVAHPWSKWQAILRGKRNKLETFLEQLQNEQKIILECSGNILRITIPKLRELCDEYSRKSGHSQDDYQELVAPETEAEEEGSSPVPTEPPKKPLPSPPPSRKKSSPAGEGDMGYLTRKGKRLTGKRLSSFLQFWEAFGYPKGKAAAADAWLEIPELTDKLVEGICEAARRESAGRSEAVASGRTPIYPQGWITGRRWEDYLEEKRALEARAKRSADAKAEQERKNREAQAQAKERERLVGEAWEQLHDSDKREIIQRACSGNKFLKGKLEENYNDITCLAAGKTLFAKEQFPLRN